MLLFKYSSTVLCVCNAVAFKTIVYSLTNGGFDVIIEASGAIPVIEKCMSLLRRHGICVYVGAAESTYELKVPHLELVATGKRLCGCLTGEVRPALDLSNLAKLYSAGRLPLDIGVRERTDAGKPIVDSLPSGSAAQAYMQLSANLDERVSQNLAEGLAEPIFSVTED